MSNTIISLLILNPNSSQSVTDGLKQVLVTPPGVKLDFYTAPKDAPTQIMDLTTGVQSGAVCFSNLQGDGTIEAYDGFLVCCCKVDYCSDFDIVG